MHIGDESVSKTLDMLEQRRNVRRVVLIVEEYPRKVLYRDKRSPLTGLTHSSWGYLHTTQLTAGTHRITRLWRTQWFFLSYLISPS